MGKANVMLARKFDAAKAVFPYLASPKLDGVRAIIRDGVVLSRNLEPIPNKHVQHLFGIRELEGLDGELVVGNEADAGTFNRTMSGVMAVHGTPLVAFRVFDIMTSTAHFEERLRIAAMICRQSNHRAVSHVIHEYVHSIAHLEEFENRVLTAGYEGAMVRSPNGPYKLGRSTVRENYLLKVVQFETSEAEIIGFEEEMHNANEKVTSARL